MEVVKAFFEGEVKAILPQVFSDNRGFFQESYTKNKFHSVGIDADFIQDNHSFSKEKGTIRGLHFQKDPMPQAKLVRVTRGAVMDYFVDIRPGSKTFGQYEKIELSSENKIQLFIPKGFAHGFCTLTDDCDFCYKVDQYYSHEHNAGIIWNDPEINIKWPTRNPILSEQDLKWGSLK
jgi:dTDP-4-dehydrorhamnose 3,5-epimerase